MCIAKYRTSLQSRKQPVPEAPEPEEPNSDMHGLIFNRINQIFMREPNSDMHGLIFNRINQILMREPNSDMHGLIFNRINQIFILKNA
jgi:hypothetical protein